MTVYIGIPSDWLYKPAEDPEQYPGRHDMLINPTNQQQVDVQTLVKEALRERKPRGIAFKQCKDDKTGLEFTIYYKRPPNTEDNFLEYTPANNGKKASKQKASFVSGSDRQISQSSITAVSGTLWYRSSTGYVSEEKKKELDKKAEEQRLARRKIGDSPKAV